MEFDAEGIAGGRGTAMEGVEGRDTVGVGTAGVRGADTVGCTRGGVGAGVGVLIRGGVGGVGRGDPPPRTWAKAGGRELKATASVKTKRRFLNMRSPQLAHVGQRNPLQNLRHVHDWIQTLYPVMERKTITTSFSLLLGGCEVKKKRQFWWQQEPMQRIWFFCQVCF